MRHSNALLKLVVAGSVAAWSTVASAQTLTIASNPIGTDSYLVSTGIAKLLSEKGMPALVRPYSGAAAYIPLIEQGEIAIGMVTSTESDASFTGSLDGKAAKSLRALIRVFPLPYGYFVKCSSGLKTISDLKGRRVAVDVKASPVLGPANRAILASSGLTEKDITAVTVGNLPAGFEAVVSGSIDAMGVAPGIAKMQEIDATMPGGVCYLSLDKNANQDSLEKSVPGLYTYDLKPGSAFPEVKAEAKIAAFDYFLVVNKSMPDDQAYKIAEIVYSNWPALQKAYPTLSKAPQDGFAGHTNGAPYHPGGIRLLTEKKLWDNANTAREQRFKTN